MVMFIAYTLQVQVRPYMCSDDYETELQKHREAVLKGDAIALRLKATLDSIKSRGRKATTSKSLLSIVTNVMGGGAKGRAELLKALAVLAFNYNTVEAVMSFCAVIVCLLGLMYQAELNKSTGLTGTVDAITGLIMFVILFGMLYYFSALSREIYIGVASFRAAAAAAARKGGKLNILSSSVSGESIGSDMQLELSAMFLAYGENGKAGIAADGDSLIQSILAQNDPPPKQLWLVFRDSYASIVDRLKTSIQKELEAETRAQTLENMHENPLKKMKKVRNEVKPQIIDSTS